jgi:hypothetical protein
MLQFRASQLIKCLRAQISRTANAKCESIPKPPYHSGIVTYEDDQTAIFHTSARGSWLRQISCQVAYRLGSTVGGHDTHKASTRRLHARLAYVICVGNRSSVAYAAASFCPRPRFKNF